MKRFSLRTIAITVPLACALVLAVWSYLRSAHRDEVLVWYQHALSTGVYPPLGTLEEAYGQAFTRARAGEYAHRHEHLIFDGESRVAQIKYDSVSEGNATGDGITLYAIGGTRVTHEYHAPIGARIDGIEFTDDGLEVSVHGNLRMGTFRYNIDESVPETYKIAWPPNTPPEVDNIYNLITERHKNDIQPLSDS